MEAQHDALLAAHVLDVIGVGQDREQGPVDAGRRLDHVGDDVLLPLVVEVAERPAAHLGVALEVEVGAVRDALQLAPADGEPVLDVDRALRVVRQLLLGVLAEPEVLGADAVAPVPGEALLDPVVVPPLVGGPALHGVERVHEELELHLLELARPEDEVARRDLVPEAPADLGDAERAASAASTGATFSKFTNMPWAVSGRR